MYLIGAEQGDIGKEIHQIKNKISGNKFQALDAVGGVELKVEGLEEQHQKMAIQLVKAQQLNRVLAQDFA